MKIVLEENELSPEQIVKQRKIIQDYYFMKNIGNNLFQIDSLLNIYIKSQIGRKQFLFHCSIKDLNHYYLF